MIITRTATTPDGDPITEYLSESGSTIQVVEHEGERRAWHRVLGGKAREIPADQASIRNHITGL